MTNLLSQLSQQFLSALTLKLERSLDYLPFVLGAMAVFLSGWILAELAAHGIVTLANRLKLEFISEKVGLQHFLKRIHAHATPSQVIARALKGYILFLFFIEATKIARLIQVAQFLTKALGYIPEVIIAVLIMLVGLRVGHMLQGVISTSLSFAKSNTAEVLGVAAKYTIFIFSILAAMSQLDIATILVQVLFIGFVTMLTLAGGLAFGLGGKDVVRDLLKDIKRVELRTKK